MVEIEILPKVRGVRSTTILMLMAMAMGATRGIVIHIILLLGKSMKNITTSKRIITARNQ
jgi:hypothetical protein